MFGEIYSSSGESGAGSQPGCREVCNYRRDYCRRQSGDQNRDVSGLQGSQGSRSALFCLFIMVSGEVRLR